MLCYLPPPEIPLDPTNLVGRELCDLGSLEQFIKNMFPKPVNHIGTFSQKYEFPKSQTAIRATTG